jgi:hypothetical protein
MPSTAISRVSILIFPALDPRYIDSGGPQQKTPFPNNFCTAIEVRLPLHYIETAVILLLHACSFIQKPV